MNRIYNLFCEYNPSFVSNGGKCSLIGHSLGSVIVFDILNAQNAEMASVGGAEGTGLGDSFLIVVSTINIMTPRSSHTPTHPFLFYHQFLEVVVR